MLLTLRDSAGVKLVKPLTAGANGIVRFDEVLPPNLRYGLRRVRAVPGVGDQHVHADQHDLFVIPTDRTLTVTTTTPDTVGPGAEVKLGLQVNRAEEVDLVVSVFDESLLGVSGDLSGSIRDFFLADARGQGRAARDLAATRLGNVSIAELVAKANKLLKDPDALAREPGLEQRLTLLTTRWKEGKLSIHEAVMLVRLAGFEVYLSDIYNNDTASRWSVPKSARLADLLRRDATGGETEKEYLSATVIDNVVLIGFAGRRNDYDPWAMHRGNTFCGFGGYQFCGGFQCGGFGNFNGFQGQFGNLGGQFGIAGGRGFGGGFGGGGFGGTLGAGGGFAGGVPSVAGFQGGFSHPGGNMGFSQPFVGGQMGMSFGFNRDFSGAAPVGGADAGAGRRRGHGAPRLRRQRVLDRDPPHRQDRQGDGRVQGAGLAHQLARPGDRGFAEDARRHRERRGSRPRAR